MSDEPKAEIPETPTVAPAPPPEPDTPRQWDKWSAIATVLIFAANVGALIAFIYLTRESLQLTRDSLRLTRESQEHAYRAWLTVRDVPRLDIGLGKIVRVDVAIENTGHSPAENVRAFFVTAFEASDWKPVAGNRFGEEHRFGVIGPQHHQMIEFRSKNRLTEADIAAFESRRKAFFFIADVIFSDRFGADRLLRFCMSFTPPEEPPHVRTLATCGGDYDAVK